jgi:hypothetical protein
MKTPKEPTPLQLFKQWKKYKLASDKTTAEKFLLRDMAHKSSVHWSRITVDGFIYELTIKGGNYSWNTSLDVKKLGSVEEFSKLVK